jgi:ferric-dicitrate binding protein FerR (iron transport regulator)
MPLDDLHEEREVNEQLRALDHPLPRVSVGEVLERARRRDARGARWAAGVALALALAAGAVYAAPGSPMRAWIADLARALGGSRADDATASPEPAAPLRERAGVAVAPGDFLLIRFAAAPAGAYAELVLVDDQVVTVSAAAGAARFTSEPERLVVSVAAPDTVRVLVPRTALRVEIVVGERRALLKQGEDVISTGATELGGRWVVPLGPDGL